MSLAERLSETTATIRATLPPAVYAAVAASIESHRSRGDGSCAARVGDRPVLPVLNDGAGQPFDLAAAAAAGPLVLVFYRGGWCPYCNTTLPALQASLRDVHAAGATLVAITPDVPARSAETGARHAVTFPILNDPGNAFARALGLVFELPEALRPIYHKIGIDLPAANGDASFTLPVPATYVVDQDGRIAWAFVEADFTRRAEPADIVAAVRRLAGDPACTPALEGAAV